MIMSRWERRRRAGGERRRSAPCGDGRNYFPRGRSGARVAAVAAVSDGAPRRLLLSDTAQSVLLQRGLQSGDRRPVDRVSRIFFIDYYLGSHAIYVAIRPRNLKDQTICDSSQGGALASSRRVRADDKSQRRRCKSALAAPRIRCIASTNHHVTIRYASGVL